MKSPALEAHELSESLRGCHECAPPEWRQTPVVSGDYDLDETLRHRDNASMVEELPQHIRTRSLKRTGYNGYGIKGR